MHYWGDEWFEKNGNDLNTAIYFCLTFWKKWGRIGTHGKEKYGTFRDHVYLWDGGLHTLIWPGYVYIMNSFIYWKIDPWIKIFTKYSGIHKLGVWYQAQIYNYAIQCICKQYPNIVEEMVRSLDGYKMVKPGIFGKVNGTQIHNKYWKHYV